MKRVPWITGAMVALGGLLLIQSPQKPAPPSAGPSGGRYQIVFSPLIRADTFLLDTQSGRTWQIVKFEDLQDAPRVWEPLNRFDTYTEESKWVREQPRQVK